MKIDLSALYMNTWFKQSLTTCFPGIDFSRDESRVSGFVNTPIRC